jgi:hypothetical protein
MNVLACVRTWEDPSLTSPVVRGVRGGDPKQGAARTMSAKLESTVSAKTRRSLGGLPMAVLPGLGPSLGGPKCVAS